MKHFIRDSLIIFITYSGLAALYRYLMRRRGPLVRILCLHDVPNRKWFEDLLMLCEKRYHVLTPAEFAADDFKIDKINILFTFDDGYQSWVDVCLPLMTRHGVLGVFFINSGLLDLHGDKQVDEVYVPRRLRLEPKLTLSWEGASMLAKAGHEFGGHTVGHFDLATKSTIELPKEIMDDQKRIGEQLGTVPRWFAYPFGQRVNYTEAVIEMVSKHYGKAFSAFAGFMSTKDQYEIPRLCLERNQSMRSVQNWIEGAYDILKKIT